MAVTYFKEHRDKLTRLKLRVYRVEADGTVALFSCTQTVHDGVIGVPWWPQAVQGTHKAMSNPQWLPRLLVCEYGNERVQAELTGLAGLVRLSRSFRGS
jgi:hypothetical protein